MAQSATTRLRIWHCRVSTALPLHGADDNLVCCELGGSIPSDEVLQRSGPKGPERVGAEDSQVVCRGSSKCRCKWAQVR